jgi:hypothetical protein
MTAVKSEEPQLWATPERFMMRVGRDVRKEGSMGRSVPGFLDQVGAAWSGVAKRCAGLSFILGVKIPRIPYAVAQWRRAVDAGAETWNWP